MQILKKRWSNRDKKNVCFLPLIVTLLLGGKCTMSCIFFFFLALTYGKGSLTIPYIRVEPLYRTYCNNKIETYLTSLGDLQTWYWELHHMVKGR